MRLLFLTVAVFAAAALVQPARAEPVAVRAEKSGNSALITFAWQEPVSHEQSIANDRVTVRFSRPIESNYGPVVNALGDFISDARPGADGTSVSFGLERPVEVYAYYTGTAVTVELLATGPTEQVAPAVEAASETAPASAGEAAQTETPVATSAPPPSGAPRVGVRTGAHPDYTRVVFDFTEDTPYEIANNDGVVTVRFRRPTNMDLSAVSSGARFIGGARSGIDGGDTVVTMTVPPTSTVRDFRSGTKVVLDVRQPTGAATPASMPPVAATAQAVPDEETTTAEPASTSTAVSQPEQQAAVSAETAPAQPPPPANPVAPVERTEPNAPPTATAPDAGSPADAAENGQPRRLSPNTAAPAAATASNAPLDLSPRAQGEAGSQPATPARATGYPGQDQLAFRFDFDEPVAAATFRRAGAIWIVFDKLLTVDTATLQAQAGEGAFEVLQIPNNDATVLRIRTSRRYNPAVRRDGLSWIIDLADRQMAPQTPLEIKAQPSSPVGARLFIPVPEPGRPVAISDPNVGDNFVVVPIIPLGQAIGRNYRYPQFELQVATQGVVISPLMDDLRVRALRQGIEIGSSGVQFAISNVSADAAAHAQLAASRPMVKALENLQQQYAPTHQFRVIRRDREAAVARAEKAQRTAARLELAKFFFANGYAPETLGVLRVAVEAVKLLDNEPAVRVMRGGANYLLGRYADALADFSHESVQDNDEARMWTAAALAAQGDPIGAARDLRFTGSIARDYPRALKMPLGILIAEVAAETGDAQGAQLFLEALNLENPTPNEEAMIKFAEGKLKVLDGDFETAISLWESVIDSDHRPSRARALVERTELLLRLQRMTPLEAIEEYEKLRFAWRGDRFEFNNLRRLGSLYLEEGYYRKGLSTLKEAATFFRDYPEAPEVTKQMSDTFNDLFLGNTSDAMDPVKAIAIYNEFKELTPAGPRGDEMIRNLADKLVEVDLLDRAASLLTAQVQFRLQGVEKARVGARLALIYTLAQEYERAFEVLQGTEETDLPEDLASQRRHLRARNLMGMDRPGDALTLLADDDSENAELLRWEIYWNAGNWLEASKSLRLLVRMSGAEEGAPLNEVQAARILNYAVALTNSGGERVISQIKREYGPAMLETPYGEAFQLVTAPPVIGILSPTAVAAKVREAETFLSAYRDKLKQGEPLSSMN